MNNEFYGDKLRLARLLNGFTQQQLGELVSTSRQYIHQLESGSKLPADDVMAALCEGLLVTEDFFNKPLLNDVKFEQCHFRKRKTTQTGLVNRVLAYSKIFEELIDYINRFINLPIANFPEINNHIENYTNSEIELAAEKCRKLWKLGTDTPIANVTKVLENAGILITQFRGLSDKVDALSLNRMTPIIVRNDAKASVCRMRFDLAHECGHFVLHDGVETGDNITEREADNFASSFLFPKKAFIKEFPDFKRGRLDWSVIYRLKIRWGMSARALIYTAHSMNKITAQQYRSANVQLNKSGQSRNEKYDETIPAENPSLIARSIDMIEKHLNITANDIANYLGVKLQLLSTITSIDFEDTPRPQKVISIFSK